MERDEYGYYLYPEKPAELPDEEDYPRRYTIKPFTTEQVNKDCYENSIRGRNISRLVKADNIPRIVNGKKEMHSGYLPQYSNLNFRAMALGIIKVNDEWLIVEKQTGINLMPIETSAQLSLIPTETIKGENRRSK